MIVPHEAVTVAGTFSRLWELLLVADDLTAVAVPTLHEGVLVVTGVWWCEDADFGRKEFTGDLVLLITELLLFAASVVGVRFLALALLAPGTALLLESFLPLLTSLLATEELSLPPSLVPSPSAGSIIVVLVTISSVSSYVE